MESQAIRSPDQDPRVTEELESIHEHGPLGCFPKLELELGIRDNQWMGEQSRKHFGFGPPRIPALRL